MDGVSTDTGISLDELRGMSEGYKQVAGYDRASLGGARKPA